MVQDLLSGGPSKAAASASRLTFSGNRRISASGTSFSSQIGIRRYILRDFAGSLKENILLLFLMPFVSGLLDIFDKGVVRLIYGALQDIIWSSS